MALASVPTSDGIPAAWLIQLGRVRYQFLGALVLAVLVPVAVRWGGNLEGWLLPQQINTMVASGLAILGGLLALKQISALPGVREPLYLVPVLLVSFLAVLAVMLFARVEYNRYLFPSSFVLTVLWVFAAQTISRPFRPLSFAVVPGGEVRGLFKIAGVGWTMLEAPRLDGRFSGVVADLRDDMGAEWQRFVAECAVSGTRVFHVKQILETLTGRVEIEHLSENRLGSLNPDALYLRIKYLTDHVFALVAGVLLLPVLATIALVIRLDSRGPAIFTQERVGFRGARFVIFKFRTMRFAEAGDIRTSDNDPRITRVGRFLRWSRLDELPQILNILRGEMSWIGPRPEAVTLSGRYERDLPFYRYRHIVRPGITGWAQVNQGHVTDTDKVLEKLHYDFYYVSHFSPWLDALIVLRTIKTMLTGSGSR